MVPYLKNPAGWCLLMALSLALAACRHHTDEAQVRAAIAAAAQAAEARSAGDLEAVLNADFDGNGGTLDRRQLAGMLRLLKLRGERVGVTVGPVTVEPRGQRLVASFTVNLRSGGTWLPEQMGLYQVESAWRRDDGTWRCYAASWKHVL